MELKEFQEAVLEKLDSYLALLKEEHRCEKKRLKILAKAGMFEKFKSYAEEAWKKLVDDKKVPTLRDRDGQIVEPPWIEKKDGMGNIVPNICLKVPTGGGKTLLGVSSIERINYNYFSQNSGFVLWIVPTDSIYKQTIKNFKDRNHPYRKVLERASGNRVKILQKNGSFNKQDLTDYLCVMVLMLQSANRETKEYLRAFRDSGRFINFFPPEYDYQANEELINKIGNLDVNKNDNALGEHSGISVKQSLANVIKIIRPIIVLDEGHMAYADNARKTICEFNPCFILELSATPNMKKHLSNCLVSVSGIKLKEEEMIKLPINIITSERIDWKNTLCQSYDKLKELDKDAKKHFVASKKYIRPIMLIQVERTGEDQRSKNAIHAEDVREYLINNLGIHKDAIKAKVSERDEIKNENLLSKTSPVRFIITKQALQEGWDCPFAYMLVVLTNTRSKQALTQIIGRILRQPYAKQTKIASLNESFVFCYNKTVGEVANGIKNGLQREGMNDLASEVKVINSPLERVKIKRRSSFKSKKIFLPKVMHKRGNSWRPIIYEEDLLQEIEFSQISYRKKDSFTPENIEQLKADIVKVDITDSDQGPLKLPEVWREKKDLSIEMDFCHMVRRLTSIVPNPFRASKILQEAIDAISAKGVSLEKIYLNRMMLLDSIEEDLQEQIYFQSEKLFRDKLLRGEICFKIFKDKKDLNWQMAKEIDSLVSPDEKIFTRKNAAPVQLSLFEQTYEKDYNEFEKKVAWYLDEQDAITWWHRLIARNKNDYYLQGWQKNKVYPDFLACVDSKNLKDSKISVIELKGDHLKGNDDTKYKKELFQALEEHVNNSISVGTIETASPDEEQMIFRILMGKNWKEQITSTLKLTSP